MDTGERSILIENANYARYAPTGHVLFIRNDILHAIRFDVESLSLTGEPVPVLEDLHISILNGSVQYAISYSGSLAYVPGNWDGFRRRLVWVDQTGKVDAIRSIPRRIAGPDIAPDGDSIVLHIYDGTHTSLWSTQASRETLVPLLPGEKGYSPTWSPDGERIAFIGMSDGLRTLFVKSLRDASRPEKLAYGVNDGRWSSNGNAISYMTFSGQTGFDIWTISFDGVLEGSPSFSPDGRWLAYVSTESGRVQIYAEPYGKNRIKHQISTDGGWEPLWSPDGRQIYYRWRNKMMAVEVQTEPVFKASSPRILFEGYYLRHEMNAWIRNYDLSPNGKRFLMIESEEVPPPPTKIKIILNWFDELERLAPATP